MFLWFKFVCCVEGGFPQSLENFPEYRACSHDHMHTHTHTDTRTLALPAPLKNNYTISVLLHNNKPPCDLHDGLVINPTCQNWLRYSVSKGIYMVARGTDGPWLVSLSLSAEAESLTRKLKSWGLWCTMSHRGLMMLLFSDPDATRWLISKSKVSCKLLLQDRRLVLNQDRFLWWVIKVSVSLQS